MTAKEQDEEIATWPAELQELVAEKTADYQRLRSLHRGRRDRGESYSPLAVRLTDRQIRHSLYLTYRNEAGRRMRLEADAARVELEQAMGAAIDAIELQAAGPAGIMLDRVGDRFVAKTADGQEWHHHSDARWIGGKLP